MLIQLITVAVVCSLTAVLSTSTVVLPLYDDEEEDVVDTLTKFDLEVSVKTFLALILSSSICSVIFLSTNVYFAITVAIMIMVAVIDTKFMLIPNRFILILLLSILFYLILDEYISWFEISLRIGFAFMLFVILFIFAIISKGGIGGADVKILPVVVLFLDVNNTLVLLVIIGALCLVVYLVAFVTKNRDKGIPLIPLITLALIITILYGDTLYSIYEEGFQWFTLLSI